MPDRDSYEPGTPSWVDLASSDTAASKRFYTGLFGWEWEDQPGAPYSIALMRGRHVAGLGGMPGMPPVWQSYVTVADVDATAVSVPGAGGTVVMPAMDVLDAGRMAVFADPTGAAICAWQPKNHIGSQVVNEPGAYSWNELVTPDIAAASAFYERVFGWQAVPFEGMDYTVFQLDGNGIAGALKPPAEGIPPHWMVYFTVADTDAAAATARELGATVLAEPFDIPGVGRIAALADSNGAAFSIITNAQ